MPTGGEVVSGQASFTTTGNTLTIQATPGTVINWQNFSIGANESVNFVQSSANSSVLNRITGNDSSTLLGTLTSNGQVSLINSSGVQIPQGTGVVVGGLTGSSSGSTISLSSLNVINLGSRVYDGSATSGGNGIGIPGGDVHTGTLNGTAAGGNISVATLNGCSCAGNYSIASTATGTLTITGATLVNTSGTLTITGSTNVGGLTGSSGSSITIANVNTISPTDERLTSWNGATLFNTGTSTLLIGSTSSGGLTGSYDITSNVITNAGGSIAVGNGIFLSTTAQNTVVATLGLGGPRLPTASTTSNPAAFSTWLNTNALVTHTQLDSIGTLIRSGLNSVLFGSHHRILRDNGMTNSGNGFWVTGDFARHDPSNTNASIGEFGVYKDVTPTLRLGAGAGVNQARQGLPLSGSGKLDSSYLVVESDYQSLASDWGGSATVYLGSNHAGISRGYMVGVTPNLSSGEANGSSWALRLRSDWSNIASVKGWGVSPYLAYIHAESRLDGYTETGGTLPIAFAAQKQTSDELRGGVTLLSRLSEQTDLRFPLELAHRSNGSAVVTGVAAANPFSFSNVGSMQDWGRVGIELDHRLNKQTVLNGAALYASRGGDSSWLGTVGLKYAF